MKEIKLFLPDECENIRIELLDKYMDGFDRFILATDKPERVIELQFGM